MLANLPEPEPEEQNAALARMQELIDINQGITAEIVVEDARDPSSPLHDKFEWDDSVAAQNYRLFQARWLIASFKLIVVRNDNFPGAKMRQFTFVPQTRRYVSTAAVMSNDQWLASVSNRLMVELTALITRNETFFAMSDELRDVQSRLHDICEQLKDIVNTP